MRGMLTYNINRILPQKHIYKNNGEKYKFHFIIMWILQIIQSNIVKYRKIYRKSYPKTNINTKHILKSTYIDRKLSQKILGQNIIYENNGDHNPVNVTNYTEQNQ
jgi:hypothetical protein